MLQPSRNHFVYQTHFHLVVKTNFSCKHLWMWPPFKAALCVQMPVWAFLLCIKLFMQIRLISHSGSSSVGPAEWWCRNLVSNRPSASSCEEVTSPAFAHPDCTSPLRPPRVSALHHSNICWRQYALFFLLFLTKLLHSSDTYAHAATGRGWMKRETITSLQLNDFSGNGRSRKHLSKNVHMGVGMWCDARWQYRDLCALQLLPSPGW